MAKKKPLMSEKEYLAWKAKTAEVMRKFTRAQELHNQLYDARVKTEECNKVAAEFRDIIASQEAHVDSKTRSRVVAPGRTKRPVVKAHVEGRTPAEREKLPKIPREELIKIVVARVNEARQKVASNANKGLVRKPKPVFRRNGGMHR